MRLLAIVSAFTLVTLTVHPDDLLLALLKLRLPYKSVLVTSLSTKFVPTLIDDLERITDAQRSRGLEMDRGGLRQRVGNRIALVIPLLSNSLDRAVQVAEAMEARALGSGKNRGSYHQIEISRVDALTLAFNLATLGVGIWACLLAPKSYIFYPYGAGIGLSQPNLYPMLSVGLLLLALLPLALVKRKVDLD